ncbi:MAG: DUF3343 domain-containing protein [Fibrobacter sp.]|nr:DUF3343 domain-containing protein [Fibrobacter sp.]
MKLVAIFRSTRDTIKADRLCRENGLSCKVIPVPKEISSECGVALEFSTEDEEKASALLTKESVRYSFHRI